MANGKPARLAVLIDAENASARIAEALFTEIATLGEASARRVYGDFSSAQIAGWTKVLARWAIQPQQNFANTKGKNSGDIALVIDAMDLLHSGRFDGFCLVSSDADLILRLAREHEALITVEEGAMGGFGAFVLQLLAEKGALDRGLKVRTLNLPDIFQDQDSPVAMYAKAGLNAEHIAAASLTALGVEATRAARA